MSLTSKKEMTANQCLCKAARSGDLDTVKALIAFKQIESCIADLSINITVKPHPHDYYPSNPDFKERTSVNSLSCLNRALHYLCDDYNYSGKVEGVAMLLDAGAQVDIKDKFGQTPLRKAAGENFVDIIKILIDRGADVYAEGMLYPALVAGHKQATSLLLSYGVVPSARDIDHCYCYIEVIEILLKKHPEIAKDSKALFSTMSHMATQCMEEQIALLIEYGVDVTVPKPSDPMRSLIHTAARYSHDVLVKMLLKAGAQVNRPNNDVASGNWRPPLYIMAKHRNKLEVLLEAGANVVDPTKKGRIPLHACFYPGGTHTLLCEPYNSPLDPQDLRGITPLMAHVDKGSWPRYSSLPNEEGVVMLFQHGASCKDELQGRSFLYHYARHGKLTANICKAAVYSGNELRTVLKDVNDIISLKQKEEGAHEWLTDFQSKPEPLKMVCVRSIRSQLRKARPGFSIWSSIFKLPIPKETIRLLCLNDFQKKSGPWNFYSSVHPHVLREYKELHEKKDEPWL